MAKILDCTLRDGGYYTNWDFDSSVVDSYIESMNHLPVDYLEVGYRNKPSSEYMGKFGYSPVFILKQIREKSKKKIVIMLNEKNTQNEDLDEMIKPLVGLVDMIRLAIDPANYDRAVELAKRVKAYGFEIGFNCMYMSKWHSDYPDFLNKLGALDTFCNLFCMVDSYGGITSDDMRTIYQEVKRNTIVPIGFHGHNNLQLGLINTITALQIGVDYVDVTVLGMGRGAGNLNLELLLTYLNAYEDLDVNFNVLGNIVDVFTPLLEKYHWGTNLPYMIAGANKIPQKEVMDWVTNRTYSFNSVVRALENRKLNKLDNAKYPVMTTSAKYNQVIVVGGGKSVEEHIEGIKTYIRRKDNVALVFATARHAALFKDAECKKFFILVGTEGRRLESQLSFHKFDGMAILPPYPRTMGTEVPECVSDRTFELDSIRFINKYFDSCTTIALQTAMDLTDSQIYTIGYDGYPGNILSEKEVALTHENKMIFEAYGAKHGEPLKSLTPTLYPELKVESIYQFI